MVASNGTGITAMRASFTPIETPKSPSPTAAASGSKPEANVGLTNCVADFLVNFLAVYTVEIASAGYDIRTPAHDW